MGTRPKGTYTGLFTFFHTRGTAKGYFGEGSSLDLLSLPAEPGRIPLFFSDNGKRGGLPIGCQFSLVMPVSKPILLDLVLESMSGLPPVGRHSTGFGDGIGPSYLGHTSSLSGGLRWSAAWHDNHAKQNVGVVRALLQP